MLTWDLADRLFNGFSIMRWTEYVRPMEFYEIEKHALKAATVFIIGNEFEEKSDYKLNWNKIVDDIVLAYLNKVAISDMNSNVHARLKKDPKIDLNKFMLSNYFFTDEATKDEKDFHQPYYFAKNTIDYESYAQYLNREKEFKIEDVILYFSHKFVTYREFEIIEPLNIHSPEIKRVRRELNKILTNVVSNLLDTNKANEDELKHAAILDKILENFTTEESNSYQLYRYFEQLRPQVRWSQTQRIPKTTVAGHSMFTALLTYFMTKELFALPFGDYYKDFSSSTELSEEDKKEIALKKEIIVNNFFAALFHDISEAFTRDVISPIKNNIENFNTLLKQIENDYIEEKILSKLKRYEETENKIRLLLGIPDSKENNENNENNYDEFTDRKGVNDDNVVVYGKLIKIADRISAFMEAKKSIDLGINTPDLQHGLKSTQKLLIENSIYHAPKPFENTLTINDFLATIPHYAIDDNDVIGGKK